MKQTYSPEDINAGSEPLVTGRIFVAAGETIQRLTPIMLKVTKEAEVITISNVIVPWDGSPGTAIGVLATQVVAPASDQLVSYYKGGCMRISALNWPESVTDVKDKYAAFAGCALTVDDE
ncbi:head decoration protein [Photobacterium leiognathi]|uniref:head decoration protein n=1 Tax=Photobacterium leiognathi TaxID=553611 RepID=UPI00020880C8|nr:head decoration protein [Photobacterium leiognathi]PSW48341.1 head decoration protein [Photobacterium leiognathi subsp. mandapamensis]GAA03224.1 putative head-DNA stabilization protein of prophage [Photobacterium leiognathi subsp. mandapamensis svers.1.1.]